MNKFNRILLATLTTLLFSCTTSCFAADEESEAEEPAATPAATPATTPAPSASAGTVPAPAVPKTEHQQKMEVLRVLANAITDKWADYAIEAAVADNVDEKLETISNNKKLTPAMKAQQKSACQKKHQKMLSRYKQLLDQNKINFPDLCLGTAVDFIDAVVGWSVEDYRDLEGMVRLVNKTKSKLPPFGDGKFTDPKWKAFGDQVTVKMNPIVGKFVSELSGVKAQMDIDEKNGKFK